MKLILKSFIVIVTTAYSLQAMDDNPHKRKLDEKDQVNKRHKVTPFPIFSPDYEDFSDSDVDFTDVMNAPLKMISTIESHDDIDNNREELIESSSENKTEITSNLIETFICCCGEFKSTVEQLKIHVKQVHNKRCPSCRYIATATTALFRHIFIHTGEKPYQCDYQGCDYAFTQLGNLNTHKLTHTGEKPYKCNFKSCDFATVTSSNLKRHMLTHSGIKPFKCDYDNCNYATAQSSSLKRHKLTHNKEK